MANSNVIVDNVNELVPHAETLPRATKAGPQRGLYLRVRFKGGRFGLIDTTTTRGSVWAEVLASLRKSNEYAYAEIDQETNVITELLLPMKAKVGAIEQDTSNDSVRVELIISQARHYLKRANPNFKNLLSALRTAKERGTFVLVTETLDSHDILDVRPFPEGSGGC